ncbi:MAG TPA: S8 family serine peptidase [Frankiaceae bacterium]|nr:S8 family serine peptidase [Frankiaceae bacterium]
MNRRLIAGAVLGTALAVVPVFGGVAAAASAPSSASGPVRQVGSAQPGGSVEKSVKPTNRSASTLPVAQLIVKYRAGAQRRGNETVPGASRVTAAHLRAGRALAAGVTAVPLSQPTSVDNAWVAARQLATDPTVAFAEPDLPVTADASPSTAAQLQAIATPNDPLLSDQWPLIGSYGIGESGSAGAWSKSRGAGVVVAVLDTGITSHPDLAGQTVSGYDMIADPAISNDGNGRDADPSDPGDWSSAGPSSWHGTHVSGTIVASTGNDFGVAGVAPQAKVEPVRVLGTGGGYVSDAVAGIYWAAGLPVSGVPLNANPARVINMSLDSYAPQGCPVAEQDAINAATAAGVTVVVAAGNDAGQAADYAPGNCANVVTVAATGPTGSSASYSNVGPAVTLAAPGGDMSSGPTGGVLSTLNSGTTTPGAPSYAYYEGTSMATPQVSGAVAQLLAAMPGLTPAQIKGRLTATARAVGQCPALACGAGILNAAALVPGPDPIVLKRADAAMGFLGNAVGSRLTYAGGGQAQGYQYGWIYYSPSTGAHAVKGAILAQYQQLGGPTGVLAYPTTDETTTPDGVGRYNHFSHGGSLYWTPSTGARAVYGAIRVSWAGLGWERGRLGYPTSSEYGISGGRRSDFQHGSIAWSSRMGSVTVAYR